MEEMIYGLVMKALATKQLIQEVKGYDVDMIMVTEYVMLGEPMKLKMKITGKIEYMRFEINNETTETKRFGLGEEA